MKILVIVSLPLCMIEKPITKIKQRREGGWEGGKEEFPSSFGTGCTPVSEPTPGFSQSLPVNAEIWN